MGGRSVLRQFKDAYPKLRFVEEDFYIWKNNSSRNIYVKPEWHNDTYMRYFQLWLCRENKVNVHIPFRFKKIYNVVLIDHWK